MVTNKLLIVSFLFIFLNQYSLSQVIYEPNWTSLNARPNPTWYDEVKFGIFIHWGVYSVPAYGDNTYAEWYWYHLNNPSSDNYTTYNYHVQHFGADFQYQEFANMFSARLFDPDQWAQLIYNSGARYVVLTSKHHEGFTLWDSPQSWEWNSVNLGPQLDLVAAVTKAIKNIPEMHMGLYHSLFEWYNPLYLNDQNQNPPTQVYVNEVLQMQLMDIVNSYEPDIIWADGDWMALSSYWKSTEFICWLYNNSTVKDTVLVNDRWGSDCRMKNGGFWTGKDANNPGYLINHKWENCATMGYSYGYDQFESYESYQNTSFLLQEMIETVSCGGNFLLDIGPTAEGTIPVIMQERLVELGEWMDINSEGIYSTHPWRVQNDSLTLWYTWSPVTDAVYLFSFTWPDSNTIELLSPIGDSSTTIELLGYQGKSPVTLSLPTNQVRGMTINLPYASPNEYPPFGVYTFKLLNVI